MVALTQPTLQQNYVDSGDMSAREIKQLKNEYYQAWYPANAAMWQQGSIDKRFKVGDQSLWSMFYGSSDYYQKRRFFFNMIRKHINMVTGYQRQHRKSTLVQPRNNESDSLADASSKLIKWGETFDNYQEYQSQGFEGACDVGISLLHMYIDYTTDIYSGDIYTDNVSYNNFLIDPNFRKQDLSDCNGIWRRRWVSKNIAKTLMPNRENEIDKLVSNGYKDGKFPLQAEMTNLDQSKLLPYDEFYYKSTRKALYVIDQKSQEMTEWQDTSEDGIRELEQIMYFQPWLEKKYIDVPTVNLEISICDKTFYNGRNLLSIDSYPFVPILCYHEPDVQAYAWRIQGIVRNLRDAQYLFNRRKVIELDILESQLNSGWIFSTDAVEDVKAFRQTGQGFLVPLKKGHLPNEVERIQAPDIPNSMMALSQALKEDITQISGVTEELLGAASDDTSGILNVLRQGAALTTLHSIYDKLDLSQRLYAKIRLDAMIKNFTKAKINNILGYEAPDSLYNTPMHKYELVVEEGNYTSTQQQTELQQLLHFKQIGIPISNKSIMRKAYISDKEQVIKDMEEQEQAQAQMQQAQAEQQSKKDNADIMSKYAKAKSDLAKEKDLEASAAEKLSKIDENEAQADYIKTEKELQLVKMMIELEDMDIRQIESSLEVAKKMKQLQTRGISYEV
ncbi:MAG: hypothetical protein PQJ44_06855 [Sphaerochaetaceae bacterium]|nr:hypothetical protein [Sphaerochaetaceae bacterium]